MYLYEKMMKQKSFIAFKNLLFGRISEFRRHPEHEFRWQWQRSRHRRRWGPSEKLSAGGSRIERSIRKREQLKNLLTTKFMLTCSRSAEVENGRIFTNKQIVFSAAYTVVQNIKIYQIVLPVPNATVFCPTHTRTAKTIYLFTYVCTLGKKPTPARRKGNGKNL